MRLRWLDLLRSAAIVAMVFYHAAYDLDVLYGWDLNVNRGAWKVFQVCVASLFLVVSGISAGFWTRSENRYERGWRRGWQILSAAMCVSLVTALIDPGTWVRFGILHLIGVSAFLLPIVRPLRPIPIAVLGIACILLGYVAAGYDATTNVFIPLGFIPPYFRSVDFVPVFPWMGPVLLGFAVGVPLSMRPATISARPRMGTLGDLLVWPGKHSLLIYLVHQPMILGVLWIGS